MDGDAPRERPRLQLKPRDESAAKKFEVERQHSVKKNPFGEAKPREAVLSTRTGKSEVEILKEEIKSERPKLRLNPQQLEEKKAAEAAVTEIQELVDAETDSVKRSELEEELSARKTALNGLMDAFEKLAVEAAARGEIMRPSERRQKAIEEGRPGYVAGGGLDRAGSGGVYGSGAIAGPGGYGGGEGGFSRGGGGGGFGGRYGGGGRGGGGFPGYEDKGGFGGGSYDRRGGGSGYEDRPRRDYHGPSDYHNAETFGPEASSFRGGGGGGRRGGYNPPGDRGHRGGRGGFEGSTGRYEEPRGRNFDDDPRNYPGMGGPLPGGGSNDDYYAVPGNNVQDRF